MVREQGQLMVLDPVGEASITEETSLSPRLNDLTGKRIGLLDDGVIRHVAFEVERLEEMFCEKTLASEVFLVKKPHGSRVTPPEMLQEMASKADAIVGAVCA